MSATLTLTNTRSRLEAPKDVLRWVRWECSYQVVSDKAKAIQRARGKPMRWDGWRRMVEPNGSMRTGTAKRVLRLLRKVGVPVEVRDQRSAPPALPEADFAKIVTLRPYQRLAAERALKGGRGIVAIPPRGGKTIVAAEILRRLGIPPTVFVTPRAHLVEQVAETMRELFGSESTATVYGEGQTPDLSVPIAVMTEKTASLLPDDWWAEKHCLIVDEFHHAAAKTYERIDNLATNAFWRFGLTGTPFRADGADMAMEAILSEVVHRESVGSLTSGSWLTPADVVFLDGPDGERVSSRGGHHKVNSLGISKHETRNRMVVAEANRLVGEGRLVLLLVKGIDHGMRLATEIPESMFVRGGGDPLELRGTIEEFNRGDIRCLVGTEVIGEGLDVPGADVVINARGGMSRVRVLQDAFRALTPKEGKHRALVVDFCDRHCGALNDHAIERLRSYLDVGAFEVSVRAPTGQ